MKKNVLYTCFISSPGDCEKERKICEEVIERVNSGLARFMGVSFDTLMWERDVLPDMGMGGQEIIDEEVKRSNYDIFIGIMKNRFGRPTSKAGSGTEHEFNDALERKQKEKENGPRILFFFVKELVDPDTFDIEEFNKVREFKSRIGEKGLYVSVDGEEGFRSNLEEKLNLFVRDLTTVENPTEKIEEIDQILKNLQVDLQNSLKAYDIISPVWIEPIISLKREVPRNPNKNNNNRIEVDTIVENSDDMIIKAPSEFGLSTLAHHIKLKAWKKGKRFLYIDANTTKRHKIVKDIKKEAKEYFGVTTDDISCILIDSVNFDAHGIMRMIKNVSEAYKSCRIIILNTTDNNFFLKSNNDDDVKIDREFNSYYLLPLPKTDIRNVVVNYAGIVGFSEDKEEVLSKVVKDLETLNLHRTVKNCLMILRAGKKIGIEYKPINRTKLLETILNAIFQDFELPTYHNDKPDVKDCSFVLGYFCELLVLRNNFEFSEEFFYSSLVEFCKDNFIELDLKYLFTVLKENKIIDSSDDTIYFKNSYWVFYFLAHRMMMNEKFKDFIFKEKKYIDYPDIMDFYTGIDRNRKDALIVMNKDLEDTLKVVSDKLKIPDKINPYKLISWNPDFNILKDVENKIGEDVITSGLPDEIKDKYDDKHYNQTRPYNQVINSVLREYSILVLMRQISALSRALRNSDFVNDPELKNQIIDRILRSWHEINKVLIVISPLLAEKGDVSFEGARFFLNDDDFGYIDNLEIKRLAVLLAVPTNVVRFFKDDLYSKKMGPLLISAIENTTNPLVKHELILLIVAERPTGWRKIIDSYIVSLPKDSFYLSDILTAIKFNIEYYATELSDVGVLKLLARKCIAKHRYKKDNPNQKLINRVKDV